jgi:O-antigen/teichoic acid export membrane protein
LVSTWLVRDLLAFTFSKTWFFRMAAYGLPQIPGSLINWSMVAVNRYFVNAYTSTVEVGYYSMATKVSQVMMLLVTSFTMAWQPFMLSRINDPDSPKVYPLVLNYYLIGTLAVASVLTIFAREFILILSTPEYLPATALVGLLVFRQILQGFSFIANIGIVVAKKTIFLSLSLGLGFLVNLIANFTLTSRFGIYGAATSEVLGYLVAGVAVLTATNLLYPVVRWNYPVMLQTGLAYGVLVIFSIVSYSLHGNFQWMLIVKFAVLFVFWAFLLKFIDGPQRKLLLKIPQLLLPKR